MIFNFDLLRLGSLVLDVVTLYFVVRFFLLYPKYKPQMLIVIIYLVHAGSFYIVYFLDNYSYIINISAIEYNSWASVLRFNNATTWFFVALLYYLDWNRNT